MLKTSPLGKDESVVVCGQPAGWKTMVQLAVWIGAGGTVGVAVATGKLVGWMLSDGEDEGAVTEDAWVLPTQLGTSVGSYVD